MTTIELIPDIKKRIKEDWDYAYNVASNKIPINKERAKKTIIMTPETFAKIFSPQRIRLILKIRKNNIKSIYQLAKDINRKYEAVHRDIKLLECFGIISVKSCKSKKIPFICEPISIPAFSS